MYLQFEVWEHANRMHSPCELFVIFINLHVLRIFCFIFYSKNLQQQLYINIHLLKAMQSKLTCNRNAFHKFSFLQINRDNIFDYNNLKPINCSEQIFIGARSWRSSCFPDECDIVFGSFRQKKLHCMNRARIFGRTNWLNSVLGGLWWFVAFGKKCVDFR